VIPSRAHAGLSAEYRGLLEARARRGGDLPVLFTNPGAYAQLDRVSEEVLRALPPPSKPLWPMTDGESTLRYLRAFSVALLFLALAGYLHAKATLRGGKARLELETRAPALAALLLRLGIVQDYANVEESLDRRALFARVFARYEVGVGVGAPRSAAAGGAAAKATAAPTIPTDRVLRLLASYLVAGKESSAAKEDAAAASGWALEAAAAALAAAKVPTSAPGLTAEDFVRVFELASERLSNLVVYLACEELFGVVAAPGTVAAQLGALYDRVVVARGPALANRFTPTTLAELAGEVGFGADEAAAEAALRDSAAAQGKAVVAAAGTTTTTAAVPLRRSDFVDFMAASASASALLDEAKVEEYLKVFQMLHLSGIREEAGVPRR
jgi:hypothetical protein